MKQIHGVLRGNRYDLGHLAASLNNETTKKRLAVEELRKLSKKALLKYVKGFVPSYDLCRQRLVELKLENNYLTRKNITLEERIQILTAKTSKRTFSMYYEKRKQLRREGKGK